MRSSRSVLITGGGAPGAAGIIHSLRAMPDISIHAVDRDSEAYGRHLADHFGVVPDAHSPQFIPELLRYSEQHHISVILPLVTRELLPLSQSIEAFHRIGTRVLVSDPKAIEAANDKGELYKQLISAGIKAPEFKRVSDWFSMHKAIQDLGYPEKPVIIKPCISNGLRGFRVLDPRVNELDLLLNHKPNHTFISLQKLEQIFARQAMPDYVVSEFLPGDEYTVDVLAEEGKVLQCVPRKRVSMANGISTRGELVNDPQIMEYVSEIVLHLNLNWLVGVQVKCNAAGMPVILEVNPRIQGTTVACMGGGINFASLAIKKALFGDFEYHEPGWGTRFVRHWTEVYY